MNYQEKFQKAKQAGYSDKEIMEFLGEKDPSFNGKMEKAQEAGYTPQEVLNHFNPSPKKEEQGFGDYVSDIAKQGTQGFGVGLLGTYGDILDLFGLQAKEVPGEKERFNREHEIAGTIEKEKPSIESFGKLLELSEDDALPRFTRFPSSQEVEKTGGDLGLISEPKTPAGKYAKRIGKIGGGGVALGSGAIVAPIAAGTAGQTLEDLGAPPWAQAAAEIVATLKFSPKTNIPITSKTKEVEKVITDLRKIGYSEQDITLAKNALEEKGILKKISKPIEKSKEAFIHSEKNTTDNFNKIIESSFPGLTKHGPETFKKISSNLFNNLDNQAKNVPISLTANFANDLNGIVKNLQKTLAGTPQENQIVNFLNKAIDSSRPKFTGGRSAVPPKPTLVLDKFGNPIMTPGKAAIPAKKSLPLTADYYLRFYKGLNAIGQWDNPKQREYVFSHVKDAVKKALVKQGQQGINIANELEKSNQFWMKYLKAKDISELIKKSSTDDGINFSKLSKSLENYKNYDVLIDGLGQQKAKNLKLIADTGKNIKNLDKQITGEQAKQIFGSLKLWEFGKSVAKLDFKSMGLIIGNEAAGRFATKLLTDPKYQNITENILKSASDQKWVTMNMLLRNLQSQLTREEDQNNQE